MPAKRDQESLSLWSGLMCAHAAAVAQVDDALAQGGLPLGWFEVLRRLSRAPEGRMRMQELADSMLLSKSGLTRLTDRLEEAGYLERVACPSDRRGTFARITGSGRRAFARANPAFIDAVERAILAPIPKADRPRLRRLLERVAGGLPGPTSPASRKALAGRQPRWTKPGPGRS